MRFTPFLIALLALSACEEPVFYDPEPVGQPKAVWPDIPIPLGMDYKVGRGHATPAEKIRVYEMQLRGMMTVDELVKFYKTTLPVHDWELTSEQGATPRPVTLVFLKKPPGTKLEESKEKLTITMRRDSLRESVCEIRINYP